MKKINFDIESAELANENSDSQFATARLRLFSSGPNRHNMVCSDETLKKTAITAYEKPIIFELKFGDFGTHSKNTIPAGFLVKDSAEFEVQEDGRLALFVTGKIWKMYSGRFLEIFKRKNQKSTKLSVEMELLDYEDLPDGALEMKNFSYTAACILGTSVTEASPGANIEMLSFAYQEAYDKEFNRYKNIDFSIPKVVKENSSSAMSFYKQNEGQVTSAALSIGKYLESNDKVTPEKVKTIFDYLSKNKRNPKKQLSCAVIGGDDAYDWCYGVIEKMNKEDAELFDKKGNFSSEELKEKEEIVEDEKVKDEEMAVEMEKPEEEAPEEENKEEAEEPKEEKEEEKGEKDDDEEKTKMSLDANLDVAAILAMLEEQTDDYAELVASHEAGSMNFSKLCGSMYQKMCGMKNAIEEMSADKETYMAELNSLREFKAEREQREFNFAVEKILAEVSDVMPSDKVDEQREDSKNFSLDNIDAWENKTKAIAFSFAKKLDVKKVEDVTRVGLPFPDATNAKKTKGIWER